MRLATLLDDCGFDRRNGKYVLAEGADAACYKPFDVPRLLDTLDRLTKASG